jgi:hypothetical protein
MTIEEFEKKVAESTHNNWLNNKSETFNFHYINFKKECKGVIEIYKYVTDQIKGWELVTDKLPKLLEPSLNYFTTIRSNIESFINAINTRDIRNLDQDWSMIVSSNKYS